MKTLTKMAVLALHLIGAGLWLALAIIAAILAIMIAKENIISAAGLTVIAGLCLIMAEKAYRNRHGN